jgi:hypothetical protein
MARTTGGQMSKRNTIKMIVAAALVIVTAAWIAVGCAVTVHKAPVVTEQRQVSDFTAVDLRGSGTLFITQGSEPTLMVEGARAVLDRITTIVTGDTLVIDYHGDWARPSTYGGDSHVIYRLTVTDLTRIEGSGATDILGQQTLVADRLDVSASGSGDITLAVQVQTLNVQTSGSSDISLSGTADVLAYKSSGSSDLDAHELQTREAAIECSGSSDVEVRASQRLNVDISGSGDVSYAGNPEINSTISGSGDLEHVQ